MNLRNTIEEALTSAMDKFATSRGLPRLVWSLHVDPEALGERPELRGQAEAFDGEKSGLAAVHAWSTELDLEVVEQPVRGTMAARGTVDEITVDVWVVTDRDEFELPPLTEQN